jgi:N-dimethylarginine dimethylaminohydrolase
VPLTEEEAWRFACNAIVLEKNVIMNEGCPTIRDQLESRRFSVFETPLSEFIKAGGSAKCLVLTLRSKELSTKAGNGTTKTALAL